jgi:hypothetical protein
MIKTYCLLFLIIASSCSLFNGFRKREFYYTDNNSPRKIELILPKGFKGVKEIVDSAGNQQQVFSYENGAFLYFAFLTDTTKEYQPIIKERHMTKMHPGGGCFFKGRDSTGLYWKELQQGNFRAGYKNVSSEIEEKFDSAVNYAGYKRVRR